MRNARISASGAYNSWFSPHCSNESENYAFESGNSELVTEKYGFESEILDLVTGNLAFETVNGTGESRI
jgi:hypothetical protein